jgi:hypothetical protein
MEVTENPSALEVAVAENPIPEDGASDYLAPVGVAGNELDRVGSASYNPAPEGATGGASNQEVALETGTPNTKVLTSAGDVELIPNDALQIASANIPSSSHQPVSHDLGLPSFFSNLQVTWFFLI